MQNKKIVVVAAGSQACAPGLPKKVRVRGKKFSRWAMDSLRAGREESIRLRYAFTGCSARVPAVRCMPTGKRYSTSAAEVR